METALTPVPDHPVRAGLSDADTGVGAARSADVWALSDDDLVAALAECEALAARVAELGLVLVREADDRDLARRLGAASTVAWLRDRYRLRPADAKARLELAHRTRHTTTPEHDETDDDSSDDGSGVTDWAANVSARPGRGSMPATGAALRSGTVSAEHARVIAQVLRRIPAHVDEPTVSRAEAELAGWAEQHDPRTLSRLGDYLLHVLDADTLAEEEDRAYRRREVRLDDDTGTIRGRLDRESLAIIRTALDPLAAPVPDGDGGTDPRPAARRMADALVELARRACDHGTVLPTARGARPHLLVITELDTLTTAAASHAGGGSADGDTNAGDAAGGSVFGAPPATQATRSGGVSGVAPGELVFGGPVSAEAVRRIACDAGITRIITDPAGVPLDVGREHRTVTPGLFTALIARDAGCTFPGCTRPPAWCHAHHIRHWADGGDTTLDNLTLVCAHHHRTVHHRGWHIRLGTDRHPEYIPPAWIDPNREPQRNTRPHHHRKRSP